MKKVLLWILIAVLAVGAGVGIYFGVKAIKDKNSEEIAVKVEYFEDTYVVGDSIVYRVLVNDAKEHVRMTYSINNGEEVEITSTHGEVKEDKHKVNNAKYYIDSGNEILDSTDLGAGTYIVKFYVYDSAETRTVVPTDTIMFEIKTATAA